MNDDLIAAIYEAGIAPDKWIPVLDRLAAFADCEGTVLYTSTSDRSEVLCSPAIDAAVQVWLRSPWFLDNPRVTYLLPIDEPRFLTDHEHVPADVIATHPYYTEVVRPLGFGWVVGTAIRAPHDNAVMFSIERAFAKGPVPRETVERLDTLRPHLARAAVLSAHIGLQRARATVDALATLALPAAVLTHRGRVVAANELLTAFAPSIEIGAGDALVLRDPAAARTLRQMLADEQARGTGCSLPLPGDARHPPSIVHAMPLRGVGRDLCTGAACLLYVTPVTRRPAPASELLRALFDLTASEARVATLLVEGRSVADIAAQLAVQVNTIRAHLKSIYAKTGLKRQADLIGLLGATGAVRAPALPS